jgi:hypothetical protein
MTNKGRNNRNDYSYKDDTHRRKEQVTTGSFTMYYI